MKSKKESVATAILLILFMIGVTPSLFAQIDNSPYFWINSGGGISSIDAAVNGSLSYQSHRNIFSLRFVGAGTLFEDWTTDLGFMFGRALRYGGRRFLSIHAGLSFVEVSRSEHLFDEDEIKHTIGVPIEIQAFLRPIRFFGIGLVGFASINAEDSFAGIALNVQWGKLK